MFVKNKLSVTLVLLWYWSYTPGGAAQNCKWEERMNVILENLQGQAKVLREYSDVSSALDCYTKCCELENEGCNVATFMTYENQVICMNARCEPFDNCMWSRYPASVAAVILRPSDTRNNSLLAAPLGEHKVNKTDSSNSNENNHQESSSVAISPTTLSTLTSTVTPKPEVANPSQNVIVGDGPAGNVVSKPESKDPEEAFDTNYKDPTSETEFMNNGNMNSDLNGLTNEEVNGFDNEDEDGFDSGMREEGGEDSDGAINTNLNAGNSGHVNYGLSITIGVFSCGVFLIIMFVIAKRFHLFKDRSKYRRLLENPEQYPENYSTSEFEE